MFSESPTDADLDHVILEGMPGTAMPGWKSRLTDAERADVRAYIKHFSTFFAGAAPKPITVAKAPAMSDDAVKAGRETFAKLECSKCHGQAGRGDGKSAPTLKDDDGHPIRAADLTESWKFNGGNSVEGIYTRLRTGLDGTPMPSFSDAIDAKLITDAQLWQVAQYVRSLSPEETPRVREVVRAARATGALPAAPDDKAWDAVERFWVPLVGQIVLKPRWFSPTVDGVWVQALHDDQRLAVRLTWTDPSKSPDAPWDEWLGRVAASMTDVDGALPTAQGPDRVAVHFPRAFTDDAERPYFLGGSTKRPAYTWRWASDAPAAEEGLSAGLGKFTPLGGAAAVTAAARHNAGQWSLQLVRALASPDTARAPAFGMGRAIPLSFAIADGSSGEGEVRGSVSAWYAINLDVPTPRRVYVAPALTGLLTAGFGVLLVSQAQRRKRLDVSHQGEG